MESLPSEIQHYILERLYEKDLCNCALVCKAWLPTVQLLLYTKVSVRQPLQFEQFQQTVRNNTKLGKIVRSFLLNIRKWVDRDTLEPTTLGILRSLFSTYLPNLEVLEDFASVIYTPVKLTLIYSQMKSLKRLGVSSFSMGEKEVEEYILCAILTKDSLENLYITDCSNFEVDPGTDGQLLFNCLYGRLDQFNRLKKIEIQKETNEGILLLDSIVESCPTLEEIVWRVKPSDTLRNNKMVSLNSITAKFIPRTNIKAFSSNDGKALDVKTIIYLMHKFPQLNVCSVGLHDSTKANKPVLKQFMRYLSKRKIFFVEDIVLDHDVMIEVMGNFLGGCKNCTTFRYSDSVSSGEDSLTVYYNSLLIKYPLSLTLNDSAWKHVEFLKKNGKLLRRVEYAIQIGDNNLVPERMELPEDIISHTFVYCPWIQELYFRDCTLKRLGNLPSEMHSLDQLSFWHCRVHEGVLESLSTVLLKLKLLDISDTRFDSEVIKMPHTQIDRIEFDFATDTTRYLKVTHTVDGSHYYYVLNVDVDTEEEYIPLPSTEVEFLGASDQDRLKVYCKTNSIVESSYNPM